MGLQYIKEMEDKFQMTIDKATEKIKNFNHINLVIGKAIEGSHNYDEDIRIMALDGKDCKAI